MPAGCCPESAPPGLPGVPRGGPVVLPDPSPRAPGPAAPSRPCLRARRCPSRGTPAPESPTRRPLRNARRRRRRAPRREARRAAVTAPRLPRGSSPAPSGTDRPGRGTPVPRPARADLPRRPITPNVAGDGVRRRASTTREHERKKETLHASDRFPRPRPRPLRRPGRPRRRLRRPRRARRPAARRRKARRPPTRSATPRPARTAKKCTPEEKAKCAADAAKKAEAPAPPKS